MSKIKFVIFLTVLLGTIGMGIVVPVLPHYVTSLGASPLTITLLFSVYALCAFLSAPLLGSLSDKFGRRPLLILSILSTFIGWLVFVLAQNIVMLFVGRVIDGLAAGNISIAQGALVDISKSDKERTSNLGIIGASFGVGYIIGPLLGGLLSTQNTTLPFWLVTFLSLINLIVAVIFLPETHVKKEHHKKTEINPFTRRAWKNNILFPRFSAWFFYVMGISSIYSTFALYLESAFDYKAQAAGLIFAIMGMAIFFNQMVLLKKVWLKFFKEPDLELWMLLITGLCLFLISIKIPILFIITTLIAVGIGQPVIRVVMSSQIAGGAQGNTKGEALGIMSSVQAIAMAVAPIFAGFFFEKKDFYPFIIGGTYMLIAFYIIYINRRRLEKIKIDEKLTVAG